MKAYLINMYQLVPKSRSAAKVKVKYKGYISQKMVVSGAFDVFHKHILFFKKYRYDKYCFGACRWTTDISRIYNHFLF